MDQYLDIHEIDDLVFGATSDQTNSNIIVISTPKSKDPQFTKIIQSQLTEVQKWLRN